MSYTLEFTLSGLPKMSNQLLRGHWRAKHGHSTLWKSKTLTAIAGRAPEMPLKRARLTLTRCSSVEPDYDGLVSTFKHVIDGLVKAGVLENDKPSNIVAMHCTWEPVPPRKGFIRVRVEEVR